MAKIIREFTDVRDYTSLDTLIEQLTALRDSLCFPAEAELRMRGDDVFGRVLTISYLRTQTAEEAACDARYGDAYLESLVRKLSEIEQQIGKQKARTRLSVAA